MTNCSTPNHSKDISMKTHAVLLIAVAVLAHWGAQRVSGATLQWEKSLAPGSIVSAVVADGRGGAVVCYAVAVSNAAFVMYLDKHGTQVNDWETVYEIMLKTGADTHLAGFIGAAYSTDKDWVAPNKDSQGFFIVRTAVGSDTIPASVYRYSYK